MGSTSIEQWIPLLMIVLVNLFPTIKILRKAGYSGWWSILTFVPIANWIMLWVFAYASWPNLRDRKTAEVFN